MRPSTEANAESAAFVHLRGTACLVLLTTSLGGCIGVSSHRSSSNSADKKGVRTCPGEIVSAGNSGLVDDFEDGDLQLSKSGGRGGYWWRSSDTVGSGFDNADPQPVAEGCAGSGHCLHHWGHTSDRAGAWGANFGANFNPEGTVNVSQYVGLSFRAKIGRGVGNKIRIKIGDVNTHPDLGVCRICWNHWGKALQLTTDWREYRVLFSGLQQDSVWGDPRPESLVPSQVYSIDFSIEAGQPFDVWVDDLEFLTCQ